MSERPKLAVGIIRTRLRQPKLELMQCLSDSSRDYDLMRVLLDQIIELQTAIDTLTLGSADEDPEATGAVLQLEDAITSLAEESSNVEAVEEALAGHRRGGRK